MSAEPKCPSCDARGKKEVLTTASEQKGLMGTSKFEIVHCASCGHIHGVFPNFMIQS